jgi:iron complex outermembrane receptor protein
MSFHRRAEKRRAALPAGWLRLIPALALVGCCCGTGLAAGSAAASTPVTDLTELTLQELMNIEVTSVAKTPQSLQDATAAVFVISREDIRRSGVTSIPEALRLAPGVQVARISSNAWAVSARGFNGRFANKLLVLMDGRTLYNHLFSGVFWDIQDTLLEDVERIEVIRGPGAALWGANAVNGVINIITREAGSTQGTLLTAGGGTEERAFVGVRQGGSLGAGTFLRLYGKAFERDGGQDASGREGADDWRMQRAGFRLDRQADAVDAFTVQGDIYRGRIGETFIVPTLSPPFSQQFDEDTDVSGGNLLSRWCRTFSETSDLALQVYFDRALNHDAITGQARNTYDLDFQHRFAPGRRHSLLWGLGYRYYEDDTRPGPTLAFDPEDDSKELLRAFVQDEVELIAGRLRLTLGSQFEHNDHTGFEIQPTLRLRWTPRPNHTLWGAISRAVHTPSRAEDDIRLDQATLPTTPPTVVALVGDHDVAAEELLAFELGYRSQLTPRLALDVATFYNRYRNLVTAEPGSPFLETEPAPLHAVLPLVGDNRMRGKSYGAELAVDWHALSRWRLQAVYSYLQLLLDVDADSQSDLFKELALTAPHHQASLRSSLDLARGVELDLWLRYVDNLPAPDIGSYLTLDARLAWTPRRNLELALVGQNLLDDRHPEFASEKLDAAVMEIERGVYGKITWQF